MTNVGTNNAFRKVAEEMRLHRSAVLPPRRVEIAIDNAREVLHEALDCFMAEEGHAARWLPEYDRVADWLGGNQGKGLLLHGDCGRGKSFLARYVLPAILLRYYRKVVTVCDTQSLTRDIDTLLTRHLICLDDIGTESTAVVYGMRRECFAELVDAAEKQGKLLLITTNLNREELLKRYGARVYDRLVALTTPVKFTGQSLRQ